ncbi:response regulator SirA [Rhizobium sp. KAs_5_22]|uniref:sulfurtransferase TusA family protein n=1 Tax=Ciceribacter selenitireducens TaxID=448181 RepID=UPI00048AC2F3|nr:sulfurtransferase TusA family protein [Ciceribacter selenitireducens]PPJ45356.1 response regulator SirA [Rhizobium sp. KAs_5_22]
MSGDALYDLKGLKCPLPVLKTRRRLTTMQRGEELSIETTDPLAVIDVPHFCNEDGHELLETTQLDNGHRFRIRKG